MSAPAEQYTPGVCNIGREEIARRRSFGLVSLLAAVVLFLVLAWAGASVWWRLLIFLPASGAASGFLQAHFHFCSGYARLGAFNFGPAGERHAIADEDSKRKDRKRGNQITIFAALIGALITAVSLIIK